MKEAVVVLSMVVVLGAPNVAMATDDHANANANLQSREFRWDRLRDAGVATICFLTVVGETRGYETRWTRIGISASLTAIVTGIVMNRKASRGSEGDHDAAAPSEGQHHLVSVSASPGGVFGAYAVRW